MRLYRRRFDSQTAFAASLGPLHWAHKAFLCDARDQFTIRGVDRPAIEAARAARIRAVHRVQVPVAEIDRRMKPHRMIEAGGHQFTGHPGYSMWTIAGAEQGH